MPELIVKLGDQTLQTCRFDGELLRIGRSRENDVVLENLSVSRHHAQLRFHDGRYVLTDMNSANGTLVNGVRITKTEVVDEDIITIGKHKLHFHHQVLAQLPEGENLSLEQRTVMVEPRSEAWLEVDSGRLKGREFKITRFETSLGKAPSNDVVLTDDWLLGKKQAIILRKGNHSFEIQDLGGLRRVKVNGTAISERVDLNNGDRIEVGGTAIIFHASDAPPKATGRVPREMAMQSPAPALGRSAQFSRASVEAVANGQRVGNTFGDNNDSLDLEEDPGYHNLKITLKNQPAAPAPTPTESVPTPDASAITPEPDQVNAVTGAHAVPEAEFPKPEPADGASDNAGPAEDGQMDGEPEPGVDEGPGATSAPGNGVMAGDRNGNGNNQRNVFDDVRSSTRRMRKHHQRAAQKQEVSDSVAKAASDMPSAEGVKVKKEPIAPIHITPDEKEIQIWEAALENASPAIRRQAARTLKKLTGRDYEV